MLRAPLLAAPLPGSYMAPPFTANNTPDQQKFSTNILFGTFSCGKVIVGLIVLLSDSDSHRDLKVWLSLALLSDVVSTVLFAFKTQKLLNRHIRSQNQSEPAVNAELEDMEAQSGRQNTTESQPEVGTDKKALLSYIKQFNTYFYIGLLVWGHDLYYWSCIDCFQVGRPLGNLIFLYLYCGYFFIAWLVLRKIFADRFEGLGDFTDNVRRNSVWSPQLPAKPYTFDMPGSDECYICLLNYCEGDQLSSLPCDAKHQFHKACVTKWLKLNDVCPLCRKKLRGSSHESTRSDIELHLIAANPLGV